MSIPTRRQSFAFLEPLKGRSVIFLITSRKAHLVLSRFILSCLAVRRTRTVVFDTSCFYGVNIRRIGSALAKEFLQQSTLLNLSEEQSFEDSLTDMISTDSGAVLIDDLNAVLHLLASRGQKSPMNRLSTFYNILSYNAKLSGLLVLGVAYKGDSGGFPARSTKRSLPKISDLQVTTEVRADEIVFRCSEIRSWPKDGFRVPLYFEERT